MQTPFAVVRGSFDVGKVNEFLAELRGESDRGAALIGVSYLEESLAELIRAHMVDQKKCVEELLDAR